MKKLIIASAILAMATVANAETVEWTYPESNNSEIDGFVLFEIVDGSAVELARQSDPAARAWTLDLGDFIGCRAFFMAAHGGGMVGNYGDAYTKCPEQAVPSVRYIPMDAVQGLIIRD